jgi:hypothetical protein
MAICSLFWGRVCLEVQCAQSRRGVKDAFGTLRNFASDSTLVNDLPQKDLGIDDQILHCRLGVQRLIWVQIGCQEIPRKLDIKNSLVTESIDLRNVVFESRSSEPPRKQIRDIETRNKLPATNGLRLQI